MATDDPLALAREAATAGGEVAADAFRRTDEIEVSTKVDAMDRVTSADHEAQARIGDVLAVSDHPVVAEEGDAPKTVPESGDAWIVDPIDGTNNFTVGSRLWGVVVALLRDHEPRVAVTDCPALGDRYEAGSETTRNGERVSTSDTADPLACTVGAIFQLDRETRPLGRSLVDRALDRFGDLRRVGSVHLTLAMVAAGELDGAVVTAHPPWETVAGAHLVDRAGGRVTDPDGDPWRHDRALVASNGTDGCHEALLAVAADC